MARPSTARRNTVVSAGTMMPRAHPLSGLRSMTSRIRHLLVFSAFAPLAPTVLATPTDASAPLIIQPTVTTATTGDLGGKFFGRVPDPQKTRRYYIAAESELWDF